MCVKYNINTLSCFKAGIRNHKIIYADLNWTTMSLFQTCSGTLYNKNTNNNNIVPPSLEIEVFISSRHLNGCVVFLASDTAVPCVGANPPKIQIRRYLKYNMYVYCIQYICVIYRRILSKKNVPI